MKHIVKLVLALFISVTSMHVSGQSFPVQLTPQNIPPTPVYLSDYANTNVISDRLKLQIILNDLTINNLEVKLKVSIQGEGINAQSNDFVVGAQPLFVNGGIPLQLGSIDLAPYFEFQNLQGINPNVYANTLPEGIYNFCYEVFDAFTGNRLSEKTCSTFVLFQNEPPLLSLPINSTTVEQQDIYNILFQWTPRHVNVSNVQYEFSLVQIFDNYVDPQAAFLASQPIFQTTVIETNLLYDMRFPPLTGGYRYAWRVRAFATQGAEEIGVFENQGFSEIWSFDYVAPCASPTNFFEDPINKTSAKVNWSGAIEHLDFNISYREQNADSNWYVLNTTREYITLNTLRAGTTYEYKVAGNCELGGYTYSPIQEFTTLEDEDDDSTYVCNIPPDAVDLSNQDLLSDLLVNDLFFANDFPITVLELTSNSPPFSGKGYIGIPWLDLARVGVEFQNIQINSDFKLVQGVVQTTYDADWGDVNFIDDYFDWLDGDNDGEDIDVDFVIDNIDVDTDGGTITIIGENGEEIEYPIGDDYTIIDSNGDVWHVDEDGNVTEGGDIADGGPIDTGETDGFGSNGNIEQLSAEGIKVIFESSGYYAYDKIPNNQRSALQSQYQTITDTEGEPYDIINKVVANGEDDTLTARIETNDTSLLSRLEFKTEQGVEIEYTLNNNIATLNLNGHFSFEYEDIYAAIAPEEGSDENQTIAGVFKLWHLSKDDINVTVVPINGASIPTNLQGDLNAIYGPSAINFNVQVDTNLDIDPSVWGNDGIDVGNSGWFAHYTSDQGAIRDYYRDQRGTADDRYYIFITDEEPSRPVAGFMPLKRQYGFIFNASQSGSEEAKSSTAAVVAHELGHGVFGLKHPFNEYNTSQSATAWLMDYSNGNGLNHMDWKKMHNPDFELYWFQGDADGESATISDLADLAEFSNSDGSYSFVSPYGKIITVPPNVQEVAFSTGDLYTLSDNVNPLGTLIRFKVNDKTYSQTITVESTTDLGYIYAGQTPDEEIYEDIYTEVLGTSNISPIIGRVLLNSESNFVFQVTNESRFTQTEGIFSNYSDNKLTSIDRISKLFRDANNRKYLSVPVSYSNEFENNLVLEYILSNADHVKAGSPYASHIIGLSSLIARYPEIHSVCNTANYESFKEVFPVMNDITPIPAGDFGASGANGGAAIANYLMQKRREDYYRKYFDIYLKAPGLIENLKTNNALTADGIQDILEELDDCQCSLKLLSFEKRLEIYNKFINTGDLDDYEDEFIALLYNTPTTELERWYTVFSSQNNAAKVISIYDQLGNKEKEMFVYFMMSLVKKFGPEPPAFNNLPDAEAFGNCSGGILPLNLDHFYVLNTGFLSDCGGGFNGSPPCRHYSTTKYNYDDFITDPQKIRFTYVNRYQRRCSVNNIWYTKSIHRFYEGYPLTTYMKLNFASDFNYANIEEGEAKVVPMLWAHHFAHTHQKRISGLGLKFALASAGLLAAPFTGGGSIVITLEVTLATGTIVTVLLDDEIRATPEGEAFLQVWDGLNMVYGGVQILNAGKEIVVNAPELASQLKNGSLLKLNQARQSINTIISKVNATATAEAKKLLVTRAFRQALLEADMSKSVVSGFPDAYVMQVKVFDNFKINSETVGTVRYLDNANTKIVLDIPDSKMLATDAVIPPSYIEVGRFRRFRDSNGSQVEELMETYKTPSGNFRFKVASSSSRYIAASAEELTTFLDDLVVLPNAVQYEGKFYKTINTDFVTNPRVIDDYGTQNLNHRYSRAGESGYYVSKTNQGNITEMNFTNGVPPNYARYRFDNVAIDNMLDLTDDMVRLQLGVTDDMIKMLGDNKYDFTHVIGTWAKDNYKGIIFPGAQGGTYKNIVVFKQVDVDEALDGITAVQIN